MPRRPSAYNHDDYDDGYDDYDFDEEEEEWEEEEEEAEGEKQREGTTQPSDGQGSGQHLSAQQGGSSAEPSRGPGQPGTDSGGRGPEGPWRCPACTFDNHPGVPECEICGTRRPETSGKGGQQPGPAPPDSFAFDTPSPDDGARAVQSKGLARPAASADTSRKAAGSLSTAAGTSSASFVETGSKGSHSAVPSSSKPGAAVHGKMASSTSSGPAVEAAAQGLSAMRLDKRGTEATAAAAPEPPPLGGVGSTSGRGRKEGRGAAGAVQRRPLVEYQAEVWIAEAGKQGAGEKETLHLVVIGHVDAGKSTLTGHLLHSMGLVSSKEMHKNRREAADKGKGSFAYAWVLDEGAEERERGVTMSLAVAQMDTEKLHVKLLDAPGHRDFVSSMISGASQADAAVLVIDSSPGAFEAGLEGTAGKADRGQTWEHLQLARSSGIEQIIVAVNKMDVVGYSEEAWKKIKDALLPVLKHSGYKEHSLQFIPLSGLEGENLDKRAERPELKEWYTGKCLLEAIDSLLPPTRDLSRPLRLPVSEVVSGRRALGPAAVSGKLEAGALKPGLKVLVMPGGAAAAVKAMEVGGEGIKVAVAGQSVDVGLNGVEPNVLFPGVVLCHTEFPVPVVRRFEARLLTLQAPVLLRGAQAVLHVHCAKEAAHVSKLVALLNPKTGQVSRQNPRAIPSNTSALVEIVVERPVCLELYSDYRSLGRITLRDGGRTIAVGIVTKIFADH